MSISLSAHDIIKVAIGIEKTGIAFYDIMSRTTGNTIAQEIFRQLLAAEREHIQAFQNMLGQADKYQLSEAPSRDQADYLKALVDNAVFTDDMITSERVAQADSDIKAVELAIGAEKDSILFYYEMKEIMPRQTHQTVYKIIAEEKTHLRLLSEIKKRLTAS
ncbi:MAG: ferritin family protein [Chloroflexi bacterium]|nr:ferritin family protein [Chloroflexota bacterium]